MSGGDATNVSLIHIHSLEVGVQRNAGPFYTLGIGNTTLSPFCLFHPGSNVRGAFRIP